MQRSSISYILKLSIPIFFANLAIPMVGIIDTALMGNLGNLSYLSATSVAANLFSMIFWSFGFLRMGTVGMVSQAYGKNDFHEILNIILRNLLFVISISIIIISLQYVILRLSLNIFDLSELTQEYYAQYFKIRIYSAPGELTLYIITGLFVGLQKTKISSLAIGFFSILNIGLSIILVTKYNLNNNLFCLRSFLYPKIYITCKFCKSYNIKGNLIKLLLLIQSFFSFCNLHILKEI